MRLAAIEIYNEISGYWLWPFDTPDVDHVIDRAMRRVARLVSKDYRAPVKVRCCGFTVFRCCCRKKNPESTLLHEMFDGMEQREEEIMEARQVVDYIDTGKRRRIDEEGDEGYLLEDDAYEAEQRLRYLEDGDYGESYSQGSYSRSYSKSYSRSYSRSYTMEDRTEEGGSYGRRIAAEAYLSRSDYSRSKRGARSKGGGGVSMSETLTQSNSASDIHWDEASASQYASLMKPYR